MPSNDLQKLVLASLFAALTAVGAFIAIPIGPVPIVLQNLFVMLMGLLLGPRWGLAGVAAYLLATAAINVPRWGSPVGDGAKRPRYRIFVTMCKSEEQHVLMAVVAG